MASNNHHAHNRSRLEDSFSFRENQLVRSLEEEFFHRRDKELIEHHRKIRSRKHTRDELSRVSGITNDAVLDRLIDLDVQPQTIAAFSLVPIIEVAWADGELDDKERSAILSAIEQMGRKRDSSDYRLVERWLIYRPGPKLLEAWSHYIRGLCEALPENMQKELKTQLLAQARKVAEASGGILGLGSKTSATESSMLKCLEGSFCDSKKK